MKRTLIVIALALTAASCSSSDNTEPTAATPEVGNSDDNEPSLEVVDLSDTLLLGTFRGELSNGCTNSYEFTSDGQYQFSGLDRRISASTQVSVIRSDAEGASYLLRVSNIEDNLQADCDGSNAPWVPTSFSGADTLTLTVFNPTPSVSVSRLVDSSTSEVLGVMQ